MALAEAQTKERSRSRCCHSEIATAIPTRANDATSPTQLTYPVVTLDAITAPLFRQPCLNLFH